MAAVDTRTVTPTEAGLWHHATTRGDQVGIPCVFMRGGTSRGAVLHAADLPDDLELRKRLILGIYGSPDIRQINGLGGADPLTSKVAIVAPSDRPDADVEFTFGQVRLAEADVDFTGNCGNISASIGPFAIDEGLVPAVEPTTLVRIYLTNTGGVITSRVPVRDGLALVDGDAEVPGVPGRGAPITLDFGEGSSVLGRGLLPTGVPREQVETPFGTVDVSIVDAGNPTVFVHPSVFGLQGTELPAALTPDLLARMEMVRGAGAERLGLAPSAAEAAHVTPAVPKLYMVSEPADYIDSNGRRVSADEIDVTGRGLSMQVPHKAYAGTVAMCTGVAALVPGTVVADVVRPAAGNHRRLRIGHPSGVMGVEAEVVDRPEGPTVTVAAIERTARRIMDGTVYVSRDRLFGE
jgi:2-methylaconitate cis-trans-isomerase PrpF